MYWRILRIIMTVKELITELQKYPEDRTVVMFGTKGYCNYWDCNEISGLFPIEQVEEIKTQWAGKNTHVGEIELRII